MTAEIMIAMGWLRLFFIAVISVYVGCGIPTSSVQTGPEPPVALTPTPRTFTEEEIQTRRDIQARMLKGEYHHDGALTLTHIGDMESVPALIRVLKDNPPSSRGTVICTAAHALIALKTITQANPGTTYEQWQSWWDEQQLKQSSAN